MQDFTPFIPGLPGAFSGPLCRRAPCKRGGRRAMHAWWAPSKLCGLPKLIWWGPTWPLKYFLSFKPWIYIIIIIYHHPLKGLSWSWSYGSWIYTYAISAYLHKRCGFEPRSGEVYSIQHYVSDLWQVGGFLRFPPPIKLTAMI
jgi:hypothetical protein